MKKKNYFLILALFCGMSLLFTQCSDDSDGVSLATISGKVTYTATNGTAMDAAGAVVKIYTGTSAEGESVSVVANETGTYSIALETGDYFLVATYNTENQNNLKSDGVDGMSFMSEGVAVSLSGDVTQDISLMAFVSTGTDVISLSSGDWSKEPHSKITWKTLYHGEAALLTGGFNNFGISALEFDEANPSATVIKGWVQLSSINTFEPGRDGAGHCVQEDLGVVYGEVDGDGNAIPESLDATTDTAWFNSKTVEIYGNGYLAKGDLIFKGVTKEIDMFFIYNGQYLIEGRSATNPFAVFEGEFTFDAANDYAVDYSGGDEIEVNIHLQMVGPAQ